MSASTGGSSRKPLQLHPLLEHQEQEQQEELLQSPSQSPSKQLSVMLLPGISCDAGSAAGAGERMAKSAPSSPDSHPRFARSASAAVRSSLGAESTLQVRWASGWHQGLVCELSISHPLARVLSVPADMQVLIVSAITGVMLRVPNPCIIHACNAVALGTVCICKE